MNENELIEYLSNRVFNIKTNNCIFTNCLDFQIIDAIPNLSNVRFNQYDYDLDVEHLINIKIDMKEVPVHKILSYILNYLKQKNMIDVNFDYDIDFNNKFDILKLQKVLRNYNIVIQIICFNLEFLNVEEQELFNELYYYNSPFYCVVSFVKENFKTYFLTQERVLDYRENYAKIELENTKINDIKLRKVNYK